MKLAYFVNQYPKVSHSFIRREIVALEALGLTIDRFALRGWNAELADPADQRERQRTRFVLQHGVWQVLQDALAVAIAAPVRFAKALARTIGMARGSNRSAVHHLVSLMEAATLVRWTRAANVQHVHAHFGTNSAEVVMLARALGGPSYSFTIHGSEEWDQPQQLKIRDKVRDAAFVVAISSFTRAQIYRWAADADHRKVHVVRCGVDGEFADAAPSPVPDNQRIVCVGRLCTEKAQTLLVWAVARLRERGRSVELVLAGDGETRPAIEALITRHSLHHCVRITGWISGAQVREEICAARALVLASLMEALPVVLMEALALGRPVVCTGVGGIPELVRHGQEGWVVAPGSVDELVDAIEACLGANLGALQAMGRSGRQRVLERHSVQAEAQRLKELFQAHAAAG
jgi:colanic acid/amylovoran biosynthesis glycosyltransferase